MSKLQKKAVNNSGIVLFAKQSGKTSFSSLYTIKHALETKKVGHTGTLDSFACGLLVVCTGSLTRLASRITSFDKTYEAVICLGTETDTLDPTGTVVKSSPLPVLEDFQNSITSFSGKLMQAPSAFSAIHINGKRASDLARSGKPADIPLRPITVYSSKILEIQLENHKIIYPDAFSDFKKEKVLYARVAFEVSKGTYIRSLARDIGTSCGSAAHLVGLLRTKVGNFSVLDAAGIEFLPDFRISSVVGTSKKIDDAEKSNEDVLQSEVVDKIRGLDKSLAFECGFAYAEMNAQFEKNFYNGRPIKASFFYKMEPQISLLKDGDQIAVFTESGVFAGIINYISKQFSYGYVVPRPVKL